MAGKVAGGALVRTGLVMLFMGWRVQTACGTTQF
jgi:hypothetical protein